MTMTFQTEHGNIVPLASAARAQALETLLANQRQQLGVWESYLGLPGAIYMCQTLRQEIDRLAVVLNMLEEAAKDG